jgi:hypothetical protein
VGDGGDPGLAGASPVRLGGSWPAAAMVRRPGWGAVASPGAPAAAAPATTQSPPRIRPTSSGSPHTVATTVPSLVVAAAEQEVGDAAGGNRQPVGDQPVQQRRGQRPRSGNTGERRNREPDRRAHPGARSRRPEGDAGLGRPARPPLQQDTRMAATPAAVARRRVLPAYVPDLHPSRDSGPTSRGSSWPALPASTSARSPRPPTPGSTAADASHACSPRSSRHLTPSVLPALTCEAP